MSAQSILLFDEPATATPPAPAVLRQPSREAYRRALLLAPAPVARGLNVCSTCEKPVAKGEPCATLAVSDRNDPGRQSMVAAEQITFHAVCHDQWWAARRAAAWALAVEEEARLGGE